MTHLKAEGRQGSPAAARSQDTAGNGSSPDPRRIDLRNLTLRRLTSRLREKKYLLLNFKQPSCWLYMAAATGN